MKFHTDSRKEWHSINIGFLFFGENKLNYSRKKWTGYPGHQFIPNKAPAVIHLCNIYCVSNLNVLFLFQVDQIEKVFSSSRKQRNWDHFSKAQRKNLELWFKQAQVGFLVDR